MEDKKARASAAPILNETLLNGRPDLTACQRWETFRRKKLHERIILTS